MTSPSSSPLRTALAAICLLPLVASGQATNPTTTRDSGPSTVKYMDIGGARLAYAEQGSGAPVVFIHGATGDYRAYNAHRAELAGKGYRAISYSMRYFGTEPWSDQWPPFSWELHTNDLASFLRALNAGPVHLATWSYSGHFALSVALNHPELVKSLFAFEPSAPNKVEDPILSKKIQDSRGVMFGPASELLKKGNLAEAVPVFIDGVAGKDGYFQQQPKHIQDRQLDNSKVLQLIFDVPPSRQLSCDELASIRVPVAIVQGGSTTPGFAGIAEAVAGCMPSARHIVVPGVGHMWPGEGPGAFSKTLMDFLKSQTASR